MSRKKVFRALPAKRTAGHAKRAFRPSFDIDKAFRPSGEGTFRATGDDDGPVQIGGGSIVKKPAAPAKARPKRKKRR